MESSEKKGRTGISSTSSGGATSASPERAEQHEGEEQMEHTPSSHEQREIDLDAGSADAAPSSWDVDRLSPDLESFIAKYPEPPRAVWRRLHWDVDRSSLKYKVGRVLESHVMEVIVVLLVAIELGLVSTEVGIYYRVICVNPQVRAKAPLEPSVAQTAPLGSIAAKPSARERPVAAAMLQHTSELYSGRLVDGAASASPPLEHAGSHSHNIEMELVCEDRQGPTARKVVMICEHGSIAILTTFLVELSLKVWVHPKEFFHCWLHMLDLCVVCLSLLIVLSQMLLHYFSLFDIAIVETILMIGRLWHILRILHSMFTLMMHSRQPSKKKEECAAPTSDEMASEKDLTRYSPRKSAT